MQDRSMLSCPGCGSPLIPSGSEETLAECAACRASLEPDAQSRITLVTRTDAQGNRRLVQFELSNELRAAYHVGRLLGCGSMGAVYGGTQRSTDKPVAIKFLLRIDADALARFVREGKLLARISHPGVLRVIDAGEVNGHPYLITELAPGGSLRGRLDHDGAWPAARVSALAVSLAGALAACHEAAVVHRDLKPANVLYDEQDQPRIADLGIARSLVPEEGITDSGEIIGTPLYMSPEQARGERVGPPADIYGLGCLLYEALTGAPPFRAPQLSELLRLHVSAAPRPLERVVEKVPAAFARLVMMMLEKDPAARPTARGVLDSMGNPSLLASRVHRRAPPSYPPTPSTPPTPSSAPLGDLQPPWPAGRTALVLGAATLLLIAVQIWLWVWR